jgi:HSP20 family protein
LTIPSLRTNGKLGSQKKEEEMTMLMKRPNTLNLLNFGSSQRMMGLPETWDSLLDENSIRVEEFQENDTYVVRAEIPGVDPDRDVEITVSDSSLCIKGERKVEKDSEKDKIKRSEFYYGSFERFINLPSPVAPDEVKATYTNGVLEVRVPLRSTQLKTMRVPISKK